MKSFQLPFIALALVAMVILTSGCKKSFQAEGGKPREKVINTFASLSPASTDLIAGALNMPTKVLGKTDACDHPAARGASVVVKGTNIDKEALTMLKPDLVVYDSTLFSKSEIDELSQLGLKTFDINANSMTEYEDKLYRLSAIAGNEMNISGYIDSIHAAKNQAIGLMEGLKKPRTMILTTGGAGYMALGVNALSAEVVKYSGAEIVGPQSDKFEIVGAEAIIAENPDLIFVLNEKSDEATKVLADPKLAVVPAVQRKNVFNFAMTPFVRLSQINTMIKSMSGKVIEVAKN